MTLLLEFAGVLLVAVAVGLFDWRLAPAVVGLYLVYVARGAR